MFRIFGAAKPAAPAPAPAPAPPPIDVGAYAAGLEQKTQQVQLQLQSLEQQIAVLKHQYAATPPGQRPILAQRLKMMMTQRAGLQRQAMSYQSNQMNVQQMDFARQQAEMNVQQVAAMRAASAQLQVAAAEQPDLEDIEEERYEMNEMLAQAEEFNGVLCQGFDVGAVDQAALDAELAGLDGELGSIPTAPVAMGASAGAYNPAGYNPGLAQPGGFGALPSAPAAPWMQQPTNVPAAAAAPPQQQPAGSAYSTGVSGVRM